MVMSLKRKRIAPTPRRVRARLPHVTRNPDSGAPMDKTVVCCRRTLCGPFPGVSGGSTRRGLVRPSCTVKKRNECGFSRLESRPCAGCVAGRKAVPTDKCMRGVTRPTAFMAPAAGGHATAQGCHTGAHQTPIRRPSDAHQTPIRRPSDACVFHKESACAGIRGSKVQNPREATLSFFH